MCEQKVKSIEILKEHVIADGATSNSNCMIQELHKRCKEIKQGVGQATTKSMIEKSTFCGNMVIYTRGKKQANTV